MKVVILAGGLGTRLAEETSVRPKPMVEIGGRPILWHIMKIYSHYGINDFIVCLGYKGYLVKEYFSNYFIHMSDVTFDLRNNQMELHHGRAEPWKVTLVDTGNRSMTGGRLKRVGHLVKDDDAFCLTYGDGLADIDISASIEFHKSHGRAATLTATFPPGRFGALQFKGDKIEKFEEKPRGDGSMINGGFFVLSPKVLNYLDNDASVWEDKPLKELAADGELMAFRHHGFWQPMDTLRDKIHLEELWSDGRAPWKLWV
ncbi:glucose-1-phosphate cytidylyltransferase [Alphaproteobacteria bacterium]|nr:glucose-1-phosphate cytidylyltransferase [Alphaproteobacteria bacterium]